MAIVEIKIDAVETFAKGGDFGEAGSYLRIKGIAKGELDPTAPENSVIADLEKAARNADGMVEYEADFFILRPTEPRRANGVLVYDVTNRGRKMIFNLLDDTSSSADTNDPKTAQDVGLGFTLGRGYSLVWSGWDSGAPRANNGMTARLPPTLETGNPLVRWIRDEFQIGTRAPGKGDVVRLNYPAASRWCKYTRLLDLRPTQANPRFIVPWILRAAALAKAGRIDEGKASAQRVLNLQQSFTISSFLAGNFTSEERLAVLGDGLRQAGLPE